MKHIDSYKFKDIFDQIKDGDFKDLNNDIWESLEYDGWIDDASRVGYGKYGLDKEDYEYIEIDIPEEDEFGLITLDDNIIEKYNDFDIEFKDKYYNKGYLDLVNYDEGKLFIVRLKKD